MRLDISVDNKILLSMFNVYKFDTESLDKTFILLVFLEQ